MKRGGIEIGAVWPNERVDLWIERYPIEKARFPQRTIELTPKDRKKVDGSRYAIRERNRKRVWPNDVEGCHPMDRVGHRSHTTLVKRLNLERGPSSLKSLPVVLQFGSVNFCPRFDEASLALR